jgi:tRNA nucleotidyltransferase (CCA-adding enzyme)
LVANYSSNHGRSPDVPSSAPSGPPNLGRDGLPRALLALCRGLSDARHHSWLVGGCVRDSLLSQLRGQSASRTWVAKDWDLATDATPEQVSGLFRRVIPTGIEHGTVTVILEDMQVEVTTLRADIGYADGRRPDQIDFVRSIDEDLARRDFTVNAMAFEPETERLIDPFGGLRDLRDRRLRAVGDPARRFAEDGLRVLRAARFVAALDFELDPDTARAIAPSLDTYRRVSAERIRDEWNKTLRARAPSRGFAVMQQHGLLAITAPEIDVLSQRELNGENVFSLAVRRVDRCPIGPELRLGALLRDLDAEPSASAAAADALLVRLRYSNAERKWITRLIRHQTLPLSAEPSDAELRRWLRQVGPDLLGDLCSIERAELDAHALALGDRSERHADNDRKLAILLRFEQRARAELARKPPLALSELAIDGTQLMTLAGFRPGREIGTTLETLLDQVIEDPSLNSTEQLLERARALRR